MAGNEAIVAPWAGITKVDERYQRRFVGRAQPADQVFYQMRRKLIADCFHCADAYENVPGGPAKMPVNEDEQPDIKRDPDILIARPIHDDIKERVVFAVQV